MANGKDWANILGEPTFEEKWASSLADIGIFPTEKIYGKDIQTPTIGIEPTAGRGFTAEQQREINERWARIDREKKEEQEKRRREEEEKRKRGGVTVEEYNRRMAEPENWKLEQGRWQWVGLRGGYGTKRELTPEEKREQERNVELTNYDEEVNKYMRSNDYQSMTPGDKLNFYKTTQNDRNKLKADIDKKLADRTKAEAEADEDFPYKELLEVIKRVNTGESTSADLVTFLNYHNASETLKKDVMEEIAPPLTAVETEEILTSKALREQKRKENELVDEWAGEYPWLRLSDKKAELFVGALEAKRRYDLDEDEQGFRQILDEGKSEFEQQQATTAQGNWATERQDKLDAAEVKKEQWTEEFGADRAQELYDNEMITLDYLEKVRAAQSNETITKDRDLMNYTIAGIKEEHSWTQALHTMGLKDKEFVQSAIDFMQTMDWNKEKEETRAREFGQTYRLDVAQEAGIQNRFEQTLTKEYADLNVQIGKLGLAREVETRLAQTASFTAMERIKKLGLEEAKLELERVKTGQKWIFDRMYYQIDDEKAQAYVLKTMSDIYNNATKVGIEQALANASIANMGDQLKFDYKKLEQEAELEGASVIQISPTLSVTLGNMSPEIQNDVTRMLGTVYDEKKGFYHPKPEEMEKITDFFFGRAEGDTRSKERFGVNLNDDEFIRGCVSQFDWSDQMKGWAITTRDKDYMWEKVIAAGIAKGVYISPEIEETIKKRGWFDTGMGGAFRKIGETFKNWFTFTEPVAPGIETVIKATPTGNLETDAQNVLTERGGETPWSEIVSTLTNSPFNYNETEVRALFGR